MSGRLYLQPAFRREAGQTLRPGGEALTLRGLELCGLLAESARPVARAPGIRVLDVGCGAGATLALLVSLGFSAAGADPSPELRAEARACLGPEFYEDVPLFEGTADALPLPDASHDAVVCECVLSLTPDPDAALAEMARVLKPGGMLLLSDVYLRPPRPGETAAVPGAPKAHEESPRGLSCLSGAVPLATLRQRLEGAGFCLLAEEDHSRALAELYARLVFSGAERELGPWLGASCSGKSSPRRAGYVLLAGRKES